MTSMSPRLTLHKMTKRLSNSTKATKPAGGGGVGGTGKGGGKSPAQTLRPVHPYTVSPSPLLSEGPQNAQIPNRKLFCAWEKANGHFGFLSSTFKMAVGRGAPTRCAIPLTSNTDRNW